MEENLQAPRRRGGDPSMHNRGRKIWNTQGARYTKYDKSSKSDRYKDATQAKQTEPKRDSRVNRKLKVN